MMLGRRGAGGGLVLDCAGEFKAPANHRVRIILSLIERAGVWKTRREPSNEIRERGNIQTPKSPLLGECFGYLDTCATFPNSLSNSRPRLHCCRRMPDNVTPKSAAGPRRHRG